MLQQVQPRIVYSKSAVYLISKTILLLAYVVFEVSSVEWIDFRALYRRAVTSEDQDDISEMISESEAKLPK